MGACIPTMPDNSNSKNQPSHVVCFNWDLSSGYTKYGPEFMKYIFQHVGILVYGTLYEYCEKGIVATEVQPNELPGSACFAVELVSCQELGRTAVTHEGFERWLRKQRSGAFHGSKHNVIKHNCVSFATQVCEFLNIPPSKDWINIAKYGSWIPVQNHLSSLVHSSSEKFSRVVGSITFHDSGHEHENASFKTNARPTPASPRQRSAVTGNYHEIPHVSFVSFSPFLKI